MKYAAFQPSPHSEVSDLAGTTQRPVWVVPSVVGGLILLLGVSGVLVTKRKKGKK